MSSDRQTDGDVLAMNGASAALCLSPLPFHGPLGAVRLGLVDGKFIPFPTHDDLEVSELDLIVSGTRDAVLMIEGFSREMPEDRMMEALMEAHKYVRELCDLQQELVDKVGVKKMDFVPPANDGIYDRLKASVYDRLKDAKRTEGKHARAEAVAAVKSQALSEIIPSPTAEGAPAMESFQTAWHESGRARRTRFDPERHAVGWARQQDAAAISSAKSICSRVCMARRCSNVVRRRRSSRWRSAPVAMSSASTDCSKNIRSGSCSITTSRRSRSAKCGRFVDRVGARLGTACWPSEA